MKKKNYTKLKEWQDFSQKGGKCEKCKREVKQLTVDHIIPVSILLRFDEGKELSYEWADNYQMLCRPCNTMKGQGLDITEKKTAKLLQTLIQPYL